MRQLNKSKLVLLLLPLVVIISVSCASGPKQVIAPEQNFSGCLIWHGDASGKNVYLTFDDGPTAEATGQILDILKKENVKATFFVLGKRAKRNPAVIRRIFAEGHDIGNHTFNHVGGLNVTIETIARELKDTDDAIKSACGVSPKFFRPPFGFFNWRYFMVAEKMGYRSVLWTIDAGDWNKLTTTEIESRLIPRIRGGYIVLLHDGGPSREAVVEALPDIIKRLKAKGFRLEKLSRF